MEYIIKVHVLGDFELVFKWRGKLLLLFIILTLLAGEKGRGTQFGTCEILLNEQYIVLLFEILLQAPRTCTNLKAIQR